MNDRLSWTRNDFSYLLLALALTLFAVAPLAYPGYLQVHSGFVPVYNLADLAEGPLSLKWTPTVATTFDPLRGDGLLPYYLALPLVWLGVTPLSAVKVFFALGLLLGAVGLYFWLRRSLGPEAAALAALVYTFLPYRFATVYVRGAWGEALFWGFLPWALAAASGEMSYHPYRRLVLVLLVWAALGLSQPGLVVWAFLFLLAWHLLQRRGQYLVLAAALGGGVVALVLSFWVAGFSFSTSPINFFDHYLNVAQLFSPYWGFGASRPGWEDGLSLGFGFAAVGLALLTLFLVLGRAVTANAGSSGRESGPAYALALFSLVLALTLLLFAPLAFLWRLTGLHLTLTYPWQLLGLVGLCLSILAGLSVRLDTRLTNLPAYATLVILTLLASYTYLEPRFTQVVPGGGPLAAWETNRLMLLDTELSVEIPQSAAGLPEPTPGRLPLVEVGLLSPGDTLHVAFTWQATRPFYRDLKLFIHLLDASGQLVAQVDPLAGLGAGPEGADYFTGRWDPGELILDDVAISLPVDAPPGPYSLAFGLYDADTLERLPVVGQEDRWVVLEVGSRK